MTQHAKLSASGSSRWMNCPGSVKAEAPFPDTSSSFADEGSAAHELGETCLKETIFTAKDMIDVTFEEYPNHPVDQEMADNVQTYIDFVRNLKGDLFIEQTVDFSPWVKDGFGTADAIVVQDNHAFVVDLKYGKGVRVDADNNSQGMLYALGVLNDLEHLYDIEKFTIIIVQPRLDHVSEFEISKADLLEWAEYVRERAELTEADNAVFVPGEAQCRFCKAAGTCRALKEYSLAIASEGFDETGDVVLRDFTKLDNNEVGKLLKAVDTVNTWIKAIGQYAQNEALEGRDILDHKLVAGRSIRKWGDEGDAEKALRGVRKLKVADIFTQKLVSPTQAEKLLGKGHPILEEQVVKPEGKPTLVPVEDKRPALEKAEAGFGEVEAA